jgi:hypothetical protein
MSNRLATILSAIGLYLITTGVAYAGFTYFGGGVKTEPTAPMTTEETGEQRARVDLSAPKTAECPLNGKMYTEAEKEIWGKRRPLGVMIENHEDARPQSGVSKADVVYEAVAEGGITRFLAVFLCGASAEDVQVGPVRSARTYFVDWISEYGNYPLYAHVGGAQCNAETGSGCLNGAKADALGQIRKYGWDYYNDINQFSVGFPTFWRDYDRMGRTVATEHTMYSTTDKLYEAAAKRGLGYEDSDGVPWDKEFVPWNFKDDAEEKGTTTAIEFTPWTGYDAYTVKWLFDAENNEYQRFDGGQAHMDLDYDQQLTGKVIVVLSMQESRANDGYDNNLHLLYGDKGTGKAWVFEDGQVIEGIWSKEDRTSRTLLLGKGGDPIELNRGQIWVEILPTGQQVNY